MKKPLKMSLSCGALGLVLATVGMTHAQVTSESTSTTATQTTTSDGMVSQFTPDALVVQSTTSAAPVSYSYSKTTTYVDQNGNPVEMSTVHSGMPVTVYYTQDGNHYVASKVVVTRTSETAPATPVLVEKKTTTTTTTTNP